MKFCKICNSLYYMKNEGNKLMFYCKRCDEIDIMDETDEPICIKLTDKSESYSTSNIRKNKYILKDNTLPRADNFIVKCINNNCLSNIDSIDLYILGLNRDDSDSVVDFFKQFGINEDNLNIVISEDKYKIKFNYDTKKKRQIINDIINKKITSINSKEILIKIDLVIILHGLNGLTDGLKEYINDNFTSKFDITVENIDITFDHTSNQHIINIKNIDLKSYHDITSDIINRKSFVFNDCPCILDVNFNSEIVYIKYDKVNLKYIYICSCCNSSWINNIKVNN